MIDNELIKYVCNRKDVVSKGRRMRRYPRWMNDIWQKLILEKKINIICDSCTRVIIQKIDIEISKDKDMFIEHSWVGQNSL